MLLVRIWFVEMHRADLANWFGKETNPSAIGNAVPPSVDEEQAKNKQ